MSIFEVKIEKETGISAHISLTDSERIKREEREQKVGRALKLFISIQKVNVLGRHAAGAVAPSDGEAVGEIESLTGSQALL